MTFLFLIPGKVKDPNLNSLINEYAKRISKYGKIKIEYLKEESLINPSNKEIEVALNKEKDRALKYIKDDAFLFLIDVHGKEYNSEEFASLIEEKSKTKGNFIFLFGSSYGLDDKLREIADVKFSLSKLTFTHYMALYLTLEQLYRSLKIINNETYDK